jgi:hypothetical protein
MKSMKQCKLDLKRATKRLLNLAHAKANRKRMKRGRKRLMKAAKRLDDRVKRERNAKAWFGGGAGHSSSGGPADSSHHSDDRSSSPNSVSDLSFTSHLPGSLWRSTYCGRS